jgi:hypothetical protein
VVIIVGVACFRFSPRNLVMYLWIRQRAYVAKSCGDSWRKLIMGCVMC